VGKLKLVAENFRRRFLSCILASSLLFASTSQGPAQESSALFEKLTALLAKHKLIKAAEIEADAARDRVYSSVGGWFPRLNLTGFYGKEYQDNFAVENTLLVTREFDVSLTQLLWDFGLTNSQIRSSQLQLEQFQAQLIAARQDLLLRALSAHVNVRRTNEAMRFARESEDNIKRQAELEDALVERGAGLSTDVLQAKVTLAGAVARRVQSEGALEVAKNTYRTVFYEFPGDPTRLAKIEPPAFLLPETVEEAVALALEGNPNLRASMISVRVAEAAIDTTRATEFFPVFEMVAEAKFKKEVGGTVGFEKEYLGKIQFTFPFNLGLTAMNTLRAAESDAVAAATRVGDLRDQIEEQARNAWSNYQTASQNAALLRNQANIAAEFLELARKERQLGKRSLIDVLAGETNLINAQSDATSAEADVVIASLTLLSVMGQLGVETISVVQAVPPPKK